jgi:hypothetical protein
MNAQSQPGPVDFDLSRGRVERRSGADAGAKTGGAHDEQVVLVPISALAGLEKLAGLEVTKQFARSIGVSFGRRVAAKLGSADGVAKASLEGFVSALAGEMAVSGWGVLHLERWGRAMVLVVENAPTLPAGAFAALLEGAVEAAAAREVHAVALAGTIGERTEASAARVLITSDKSAQHARRWLVEGASEAEVLRRLHDETKDAGGAE